MPSIAVIIPSYKVTNHIADVISRVGQECSAIYVVDDCCPDESGAFVEANISDPRVKVVYHEVNQGVGGAVMTGYRTAIDDGHDILVKVDGDGQMAPELITFFVAPILAGEADYTKGNRFYDLADVAGMPKMRILGNAVLSFFSKVSSGYWDIFDPTNGYTALHARVASHLPFDKIAKRYFFESDMLFRLNTLRAVVMDVPMTAHYGDEVSNLHISKIVWPFTKGHLSNFVKRVFYNYFLRDVSAGSIQLLLGSMLLLGGALFGAIAWGRLSGSMNTASAGTVMLAALPMLIGLQLLLSFLMQDIQSVPRLPIFKRLGDKKSSRSGGILK